MPQRRRRATIEDVAARAGVSRSAVSKVLNDAYGVSQDMRDRVQAAIEELSYRPQAGARAMRGRTYTIGLVLSDLRSPFAHLLIDGVQGELEGSPYKIVLGPGGPNPERQQRSIEALVDLQIDGLILLTPTVPAAWLEELGRSIPCVAIGRHGRPAHYDTVIDDDALGAALMVDHLVGLGHRRICHIAHAIGGLRRPSVLPHTVRADSFRAAMEAHGLEPDIIVTEYTEEGGYRGAAEAMARPTPPTAIFAGADIAALGVLRLTSERGLRVPENLSVAGYDNTEIASMPQISLTTVDQYPRLSGSTGARLLRERLEGRVTPVTHCISPRLVARSSAGPCVTPAHRATKSTP